MNEFKEIIPPLAILIGAILAIIGNKYKWRINDYL